MSIKASASVLVALALFTAAGLGEESPVLALDMTMTITDGGVYTMELLTVTLFWTIAGFPVDLSATADPSGMTSLSLGTKKSLGFAKLSAKLLFDANPPAFRSFQVSFTGDQAGITWGYLFNLAADPADSFQQLSLGYKTDTLSLAAKANFGLFNVEFQESLLSVTWAACPSCDLSASVTMFFVKEGFEYVDFSVKDIPLPCPECTVFRLFLDTVVTFTEDSKLVLPTVRLKTQPFCADFSPAFSLDWDSTGFSIAGVHFTGWTCKIRFPGDILATLTTNLALDAEFFETYSLTGPIPLCCGLVGKWLLALDFSKTLPGPRVFDWGRFTGQIEIPILRQATILVKTVFSPVAPTWSLTFGLKSLW